MASASNIEGESAKWTKAEVDIFVSVMLEEVVKGNKTTSTFNKVGWNNIKTQVESRVGHPFSFRQLRNKMNKLRIDYNNFKRLLGTFGFGWDKDKRTVSVEDPSIWDRHIKENPSWSKFRRQGLPQWPELCMIYGDSHANGEGGVGNAQEHNVFNEDEDLELDPPLPICTNGLGQSEAGDVGACTSSSTERFDRTPQTLMKRSRSGDLVTAINRMVDVSQAKLDFFTSCSSPSANSEPTDYTIAKCIAVLEGIPDLGKELYMKAVYKITSNPEWRELLIAFPANKKMWLLESLN